MGKNMKNIVAICILIIASILFSGCLRSYYPVAYHSSAPPNSVQINNTSNEYSDFINASTTISKGEYPGEKFNLFKLGYLTAKTGDHYNFNIGFFGQGGSYKVVGLVEQYNGNKSFYGFGSEISALINLKFEQFKFGLGSNMGLGFELGEYYDFRKNATKNDIIDGQDNFVVGMINIFPYISYQISESTTLSTQLNVGLPNGFSPILQINNEFISFWVNWTPQKFYTDKVTTQRVSVGVMVNVGSSGLIF